MREELNTDIQVDISIEDRARVMQSNRQASQALNGRDLAVMLGVKDKALLDSWKLERHQKSTFKRLRDADEEYLHGIVRDLLRYRGLQESAGGNWAPILEMHCFEVRNGTLVSHNLMLM
jgi:hypothetical protein